MTPSGDKTTSGRAHNGPSSRQGGSGGSNALARLSRRLCVAAFAVLYLEALAGVPAPPVASIVAAADATTAGSPGLLDWLVGTANAGSASILFRDGPSIPLDLPLWLLLGTLGAALWVMARLFGHSRPSRELASPSMLPHALGMFVLGAGTCLAVVDVALRTSAQSQLTFTSIGEIWRQHAPDSLLHLQGTLMQGTLTQHAPALWDPVILALLRMPLAPSLLILGFALLLLGRRRGAPADTAASTAASATPARQVAPGTELRHALGTSKRAFVGIAVFSAVSNLLMLTGAFYMLQIYDRIIPSRSVPTLVALSILAGALFLAQGALDLVRGRILSRIGDSLDEMLSRRIYDIVVRSPLEGAPQNEGLQPMRDLDSVRGFLSGQGPSALFDLPWLPIYLAIIFAFHFALGATALAGAIVLVIIALMTEVFTRGPITSATKFAKARIDLADGHRRNAEVLAAMGMTGNMGRRWLEANRGYMASNRRIADVTVDLGSVSRCLRLFLQSAVLAVGAYFVIRGEATGGIIIAGSILVARALAPVDLAIANWRGFVSARQSWVRLTKLMKAMPTQAEQLSLPEPRARLSVEDVSAAPPGVQKLVVGGVSFKLEAGQGLGVIGPSASGKSSLARLLVGVWQPARGRVCIDGAALPQWSRAELGRHIGYLPQSVELFAGTIAENISRFDPEATDERIIAAAKVAGVHDMIVAMPGGYGFHVGDHGAALSAGQRQRIGLARALYGDPFLVVLDEPNSNLDADGESSLTRALQSVRERGGIAIVIAHRRAAIDAVDLVLMMNQGRSVAFGPKEEVLAKVLGSPSTQAGALKVVAGLPRSQA